MKRLISLMAGLLCVTILVIPAVGQQNWPLVYIDAAETVDSGNSIDKVGQQVDFGSALAAAIIKKKTPVTVVMDSSKAKWRIESITTLKEDSESLKRTKEIFGGVSLPEYSATIKVIDIESTAVIFGYNVTKNTSGGFQSAAEAFAKHFKNHLEKK